MSTVKITDDTFQSEVLESNIPVPVDFWASWCGHAAWSRPILEELAEEYADRVKIAKVDADTNPASTAANGIVSIPTLNVCQGWEAHVARVPCEGLAHSPRTTVGSARRTGAGSSSTLMPWSKIDAHRDRQGIQSELPPGGDGQLGAEHNSAQEPDTSQVAVLQAPTRCFTGSKSLFYNQEVADSARCRSQSAALNTRSSSRS